MILFNDILFFVRNDARTFHVSSSTTPMQPAVDFGPPSPEALAWKSTSAGDCSRPLSLSALTHIFFRNGPGRS